MWITSGFTGYQNTYTDEELGELKKKAGRKPAYVMFNNSTMKEDALRFMDLLRLLPGRLGLPYRF